MCAAGVTTDICWSVITSVTNTTWVGTRYTLVCTHGDRVLTASLSYSTDSSRWNTRRESLATKCISLLGAWGGAITDCICFYFWCSSEITNCDGTIWAGVLLLLGWSFCKRTDGNRVIAFWRCTSADCHVIIKRLSIAAFRYSLDVNLRYFII